MYFDFREYYANKNHHKPIITLGYYDNPKDSNNILTTFTFNSFFDRLSVQAKEEIENILIYSNNDCINNEIWFKYKIAHSLTIPKIGENYKKVLNKINDNQEEDISLFYYRNKRLKKLNFDKSSDFFKTKPLNLFDNLANNKKAEYNLVITKDAVCNNEVELLYTFLNCLFSSQQETYYVKKCKYCKNYYVDSYYKTSYCERTYIVKERNIPCGNIKSHIKKQNEYKKFIKSDRNFQRFLQEHPILYSKLYIDYMNKRDNLVSECIQTRDLTILNNFVENYKNEHVLI